jgi:ribosomal-protein-alanine N-acetyltransferase
MSGIIETARLILRTPELSDAEPFAAMMCENIARWTGSWKGDITPAEVADKIAGYLATEARGFAFNRTAVIADTGAIIGLIGVRRLDDNPARGAIGYWIGEAWFGRGYTKEAARAILGAAWDVLPVDIIEGAAQLPNAASIAVLKGLGMTYQGERDEFASARGVSDRCAVYETARPAAF